MKLVKIALMAFALTSLALVYTSCGNQAQAATEQGKEYTSAYICPMHCDGSGSEEMGQCPVCGMDYVANANSQSTGEAAPGVDAHEGHDHSDHDHEGHDHEGHSHDEHDHSGHDHQH